MPRIEESAFQEFDKIAESSYKIKRVESKEMKPIHELHASDDTCYSSTASQSPINRPQVLKIKSLNQTTHRDNTEYECRFEHDDGKVCGKTFGRSQNFLVHYQAHMKHKPFKCESCSKSFTLKGNLKKHTSSQHAVAHNGFSLLKKRFASDLDMDLITKS